MTTGIKRFGVVLLAAFAITMVYTAYWAVVRRDPLLAREDNPRLVLAAERIERGTIYDRDGSVLAESRIDPQTGAAERRYPVPEAAPVTGYYSLRFGEGGIEAAFDDVLDGSAFLSEAERFRLEVLNQAQDGGDVRLTADLELQREVETLLHGLTGAAVVLDAETGHILAMGSSPSYNPNRLDQAFDSLRDDPASPLLNRATQSLYQPGTALQAIVLGAGLDNGVTTPDEPWRQAFAVRVVDTTLPCAEEPSAVLTTVGEAFIWGCPAPLASIGSDLGTLRDVLARFGLLSQPQLPIELPEANAALNIEAEVDAVGQGDLLVSPLQMALAAAALSNDGLLPAPQIVVATQPPGESSWQPAPAGSTFDTGLSPEALETLRDLMRDAARFGSARAASQQAEVFGHSGLAVSGLDDDFVVWFIGFAYQPDGSPIVTAVVIEDSDDAALAASIGGAALAAALTLSE